MIVGSTSLDGNPLDQKLLIMVNDAGPTGFGRYHAEELCKRSDFNLQLLESYVKECGVNFSDGSRRYCQVILQSIRVRLKTSMKNQMMRECEE